MNKKLTAKVFASFHKPKRPYIQNEIKITAYIMAEWYVYDFFVVFYYISKLCWFNFIQFLFKRKTIGK